MNIRYLIGLVSIAVSLESAFQVLPAQAVGFANWRFSGSDNGYTYSGTIMTGDGPYYNENLVALTYFSVTSPTNSTFTWPGDEYMNFTAPNTWDVSLNFFGIPLSFMMNDLTYNNLFSSNPTHPFFEFSIPSGVLISERVDNFNQRVSTPEPSEMLGLLGLGVLGLGLGIKRHLKVS